MTRPARWRGYNERKVETLRIFASHGALTVGDFAVLSGMRPKRGIYSYLGRLARWRLLRRSKSPGGRIAFTITPRGRGRLTWLRARCSTLIPHRPVSGKTFQDLENVLAHSLRRV
jgi:hypothetical protein